MQERIQGHVQARSDIQEEIQENDEVDQMSKYLLIGGPADGERIEIYGDTHCHVFDYISQDLSMSDYSEDMAIEYNIPYKRVAYYRWRLTDKSPVFYVYSSIMEDKPDDIIAMLLDNYKKGAQENGWNE